MQMVDVWPRDQAVHGSVDRRSGAAFAVQAKGQRSDHLVVAFLSRIVVGEPAQAIETQDGKTVRSDPRSPPDPLTQIRSRSFR